jgi:Cytochrome C oxidase, cbb3-type, subunit III
MSVGFLHSNSVARRPDPRQKTTFVVSPPPEPTDTVSIGHGEPLFARYCSGCHGERALGGGVTPDLRASGLLGRDFLYNVVLDGALKDAGMASFKSVLDRDDVTAIRNYLIHRPTKITKGSRRMPLSDRNAGRCWICSYAVDRESDALKVKMDRRCKPASLHLAAIVAMDYPRTRGGRNT